MGKNNTERRATIIATTVAIITILLASSAAALEWSEIMFNPLGSDNNREFVELTGTEALDGCTIRDSASSDRIILLHPGATGNAMILILENESVYHSMDAVLASTVYVIGSAIGNGLGNSYETLAIVCDNTTLVTTSYNVSLLENFSEGHTIIRKDGAWILGAMNGTPGWPDDIASDPVDGRGNATDNTTAGTTENTTSAAAGNGTTGNASNSTVSTTPTDGAPAEPRGDEASSAACNESLQLLMGASKALVGGDISFMLFSPGFAAYEARDAGGRIFAAGDNIKGSAHTVIAPNTTIVSVTASAAICGTRQRMTRKVAILRPAPPPVEASIAAPLPPLSSAPPSAAEPPLRDGEGAEMTISSAASAMAAPSTRVPRTTEDAATPSGAVIMDSAADAVPWISLFGAVTVIVSAIVFLHVLRAEKNGGKKTDDAAGNGGNATTTSYSSGLRRKYRAPRQGLTARRIFPLGKILAARRKLQGSPPPTEKIDDDVRGD